jgi:hypothetical protein
MTAHAVKGLQHTLNSDTGLDTVKGVFRHCGQAMTDGHADSKGPAIGSTLLSDWMLEHAPILGISPANELKRRSGSSSDR